MLFRALLDQGALAIAVVDASGRLKMMSRGLQGLVGSAYRHVRASAFPEGFHLYNADGTRILRAEDVALGRANNGELVRDVVVSVRPLDQPARYFRCNAVPLKDPQGEKLGSVVLVVDVTAEHVAAGRQEGIRRLLMDTVNHELRTPLTVVLANAELVSDMASGLPDTVRERLSAIDRASGKLRETLQRVADLVDLEAVTQIERRECHPWDILASAAERCRHQADERSISIGLECSADLTWSLDRNLVSKAITALLDNALRHGPRESEVTLTAAVMHRRLRLSVRDQGCGIPEEDQERLTEPFERGPSGLDREHSSGLGLPLARAVARCHDGTLLFDRARSGFTASLFLA